MLNVTIKPVRLLLLFILLAFVLPIEAETRKEVKYFDIWEYQILGNSLLKKETIESALFPYLGVQKSLKTVEQARDYLQNLYKMNGYPIVVVSIPQQNVIGGKVKLQVTEGKIDRLKISGNEYFSRRELRDEVPSLSAGAPLNMDIVREEVDLANKANPYRTVVPVIRPGRKRGTMEMELKVRDRLPVNASLETNNRYSASTSETRVSASVGYDHLWQKHHSVSFGYQMTPEVDDEISVVNANYSFPATDFTKLVFYGVDSNSRVATVTGQGDNLAVLGNGQVFGFRSITSMPSYGQYFHSLSVGIDYKDFGETQELSSAEDAEQQEGQETVPFTVPISYGAWSISYNGGWKDLSLTLFSLDANFGLRGLNKQSEFEFKRFLAKANYFYLSARFSQSWNLGSGFGWEYDFSGQYTESPLISNEQSIAGGVDTVRGYLESTAVGDNSMLGSTALTYTPLSEKKNIYMQNLRFSLFVDAAKLRVLDPLPNAEGEFDTGTSLLGAGIGVEFKAFKYLDATMFYAEPLEKLDDEDFEDEGRVHFSLAYRFR